ncbi:sensor histidine kinase [Mesorhizobium australicum]|uniref:histidine kinase n=1 Tax=Mesorhizobium australicum TaxID=536018 RepID=A0A1X7PTG2_9HYPH|nr:HAMP domain-containing sensor histidine kinase [Mesorhizobium australicum]SMH55268.1 Signal transduction histidine kinase [Mesorhizobium australicum]
MRSTRSLRLRFFALGLGLLAVALVVTGIGLSALFSRHLDRRVGQELDTHLQSIAGTLRIDRIGTLSLAREPADPRFSRPFGGLYWQIEDQTAGGRLASRSLWDFVIPRGPEVAAGAELTRDTAGPQGTSLLLHERNLVVPVDGVDHRLRVTVGIDRAQLAELRSGFARDTGYVLAALGSMLAAGIWIQIVSGLRPLAAVAEAVGEVRAGRARRLSTRVPREVEPLVTEMNSLLDTQERELVRARDRAADLAHGLKTPLTAIAADIRRLRERGDREIADNLEALADSMRRHVDRELTRTRLRHGTSRAATPLADAARRIARVVERIPAAEGKTITVGVPDTVLLPVDGDDLNEMLGNLLDNAARHARSRVRVGWEGTAGTISLLVEDDGPGLAEDERAVALARGGRLDRSGAAGLGLAIVRDITEAYGGSVTLGRSELGGLSARIDLPRLRA